MSKLIITPGIDEESQLSDFQNATLQGKGRVCLSVAVHLNIPAEIQDDEAAVEDWLRDTFNPLATSSRIEQIEIQLGNARQ